MKMDSTTASLNQLRELVFHYSLVSIPVEYLVLEALRCELNRITILNSPPPGDMEELELILRLLVQKLACFPSATPPPLSFTSELFEFGLVSIQAMAAAEMYPRIFEASTNRLWLEFVPAPDREIPVCEDVVRHCVVQLHFVK